MPTTYTEGNRSSLKAQRSSVFDARLLPLAGSAAAVTARPWAEDVMLTRPCAVRRLVSIPTKGRATFGSSSCSSTARAFAAGSRPAAGWCQRGWKPKSVRMMASGNAAPTLAIDRSVVGQ